MLTVARRKGPRCLTCLDPGAQRGSGKTPRRSRARPGQSAVTPEDVAAELDVLASRVRRMSPPLSSDPERFHAQRSVIAHDLAELARRIAPRSQTHLRARGRTLGKEAWPDRRRHSQAINGRPVTVQ